MSGGLLLIDKPPGPTSHDAVLTVRRAYRVRRVGHTGTLDPFASGLLAVLLGRATRLARYLMDLPKVYSGEVRLGIATTTDDPTGAVIATRNGWEAVSDDLLRAAMQQLTGRRQQVPPAYSAKHVAGQRAHRLARRGAEIALAPQTVAIDAFVATGRSGPDVQFRAEVSSGTYIRALARELGDLLGCGAHLRVLRRLAIGPFRLDEAAAWETVRAAAVPVRPALDAVRHLPQVELDAAQCEAVAQGRPIAATSSGDGAVVLTHRGVLAAVARAAGDRLLPEVVLVQ